MKFFSDVRLLLLSIWLGSAVFFIGVAQTAFAVLPERELAGAVVSRTLTILNLGGLAIAVILIATSFIGTAAVGRASKWAERFLLMMLAAACAIGQFVIGLWLTMIRAQLGRPIDEVAADDPLRIQFNSLHEWSVWILMAGMAAALIVFFIIANRRPIVAVKSNDPYDFSNEFKV
jgi:hypothetical protein